MITLTKIRELDLSSAAGAASGHLSAASGLVRAGAFLYVVADDELHLGVFHTAGTAPGQVIRLFEGELPDGKIERKRLKPDLEALMRLPPSGGFPHGALMALGSGSTRNRRKGALIRLDAQGAVQGRPDVVDLAPIFSPLDDFFQTLNIEGAVAIGGEVRLFQRGNRTNRENAIVRFPLSSFLAALGSKPSGSAQPLAIHRVDLGEADGVPFCFTDAAPLPDGSIVFTAVAEDTADAYNDGPCGAAVIGVVDGEGHIRRITRIDGAHKLEGVDASADGNTIRLLLVTDADDPEIPASLFSATMEW